MANSTKAAPKEPEYSWDPRGICLVSLTASWEATAARSSWSALLDKAQMSFLKNEEGDGIPSASAMGLSVPLRKGCLVVNLSVHGHQNPRVEVSKDPQIEAHWTLEVYRAPSATPPPGVLDASARAGGSKGLLNSLRQNWPHDQPLRLRVSASYLADGAKFTTSSAIQQARPKILRPGGGLTMRASATIWELRQKDRLALATVGYHNRGKIEPIPLNWRGTVEQSLTNDLVSQLDALVWGELQVAVNPTKNRARAAGHR